MDENIKVVVPNTSIQSEQLNSAFISQAISDISTVRCSENLPRDSRKTLSHQLKSVDSCATCAFCCLEESCGLGQGKLLHYVLQPSDLACVSSTKRENVTSVSLPRYSADSSSLFKSLDESKSLKLVVKKEKTDTEHRHAWQSVLTPTGSWLCEPLTRIGHLHEPVPLDLLDITSCTASQSLRVHECCLLWASLSGADQVEFEQKSATAIISTSVVLRALLSACTTRCVFCHRFGASVKCHVLGCTNVYHFACALASGAFLIQSQRHTYCNIHLDQVNSDNVSACAKCYKAVSLQSMLFCCSCGNHFHVDCLTNSLSLNPNLRTGWQCGDCKVCQLCHHRDDENSHISCYICDKAFHACCVYQGMSITSRHIWRCEYCRVCLDCGTRSATRWHNDYKYCGSCHQQRNKGFVCHVCNRAYRYSDIKNMVHCDICDRCIHKECWSNVSMKPDCQNPASLDSSSITYICDICKNLQQSGAELRDNSVSNRSLLSSTASNSFFASSSMSLTSSNSSSVAELKDNKCVTSAAESYVGRRRRRLKSRHHTQSSWSLALSQSCLSNLQRSDVHSESQLLNQSQGAAALSRLAPATAGGACVPSLTTALSSDSDDENQMMICSTNDENILQQDVCVMCGSLGLDMEGRVIACAQCGQTYHPYCANVKVSKVILERGFRCMDCTICEGCGERNDEARLILCDDCDISYHIYCVDPPLDEVPQGAWRCKWCSVCLYCGANGLTWKGSWFDNYTVCGVCHSYTCCSVCCQLFIPGQLVINCSVCLRWCHAADDNIYSEDDAEVCVTVGYQCPLCKCEDKQPAHIKDDVSDLFNAKLEKSPNSSFWSASHQRSYYLDGVQLTDDGYKWMQQLQPDVVRRKKKKTDPSLDSVSAAIDSVVAACNTSEFQVLKKDTSGDSNESFSWKESEMFMSNNPMNSSHDSLNSNHFFKKKPRNLQKFGVGGFFVKTRGGIRGGSRMHNDRRMDEAMCAVTSMESFSVPFNKVKRRFVKRNRRVRLIDIYPAYLQEAFFGKDLSETFDSSQTTMSDDEMNSRLSLNEEDQPDEEVKIVEFELSQFECDMLNEANENTKSDQQNIADVTSECKTSSDDKLTHNASLYGNSSVVPDLNFSSPIIKSESSSQINEGTSLQIAKSNNHNELLNRSSVVWPECSGGFTEKRPVSWQPSSEPAGVSVCAVSDDTQCTAASVSQVCLPAGDTHVTQPATDSDLGDILLDSIVSSLPTIAGADMEELLRQTLLIEDKDDFTSLQPISNSISFSDSTASSFSLDLVSDKCANNTALASSAPIVAAANRHAIKWMRDELLGDKATISAVLYSNLNKPDLKQEFPSIVDRVRQMTKIWRGLTPEDKQPYLQQAKENRIELKDGVHLNLPNVLASDSTCHSHMSSLSAVNSKDAKKDFDNLNQSDSSSQYSNEMSTNLSIVSTHSTSIGQITESPASVKCELSDCILESDLFNTSSPSMNKYNTFTDVFNDLFDIDEDLNASNYSKPNLPPDKKFLEILHNLDQKETLSFSNCLSSNALATTNIFSMDSNYKNSNMMSEMGNIVTKCKETIRTSNVVNVHPMTSVITSNNSQLMYQSPSKIVQSLNTNQSYRPVYKTKELISSSSHISTTYSHSLLTQCVGLDGPTGFHREDTDRVMASVSLTNISSIPSHTFVTSLHNKGVKSHIPLSQSSCPVILPIKNNPAPPMPKLDDLKNNPDLLAVQAYEQWVFSEQQIYAEQLKILDAHINKYRRQRRSLSSKQRNLRKKGVQELDQQDVANLERICAEQAIIQKQIDTVRRLSKQHNQLAQEFTNKLNSAHHLSGCDISNLVHSKEITPDTAHSSYILPITTINQLDFQSIYNPITLSKNANSSILTTLSSNLQTSCANNVVVNTNTLTSVYSHTPHHYARCTYTNLKSGGLSQYEPINSATYDVTTLPIDIRTNSCITTYSSSYHNSISKSLSGVTSLVMTSLQSTSSLHSSFGVCSSQMNIVSTSRDCSLSNLKSESSIEDCKVSQISSFHYGKTNFLCTSNIEINNEDNNRSLTTHLQCGNIGRLMHSSVLSTTLNSLQMTSISSVSSNFSCSSNNSYLSNRSVPSFNFSQVSCIQSQSSWTANSQFTQIPREDSSSNYTSNFCNTSSSVCNTSSVQVCYCQNITNTNFRFIQSIIPNSSSNIRSDNFRSLSVAQLEQPVYSNLNAQFPNSPITPVMNQNIALSQISIVNNQLQSSNRPSIQPHTLESTNSSFKSMQDIISNQEFQKMHMLNPQSVNRAYNNKQTLQPMSGYTEQIQHCNTQSQPSKMFQHPNPLMYSIDQLSSCVNNDQSSIMPKLDPRFRTLESSYQPSQLTHQQDSARFFPPSQFQRKKNSSQFLDDSDNSQVLQQVPNLEHQFPQSPQVLHQINPSQSLDRIPQSPQIIHQINPSQSLDRIPQSPQILHQINPSPQSFDRIPQSPQILHQINPSPQPLDNFQQSPQTSHQLKHSQPHQISQVFQPIKSVEPIHQSPQSFQHANISPHSFEYINSPQIISSKIIVSNSLDSMSNSPQVVQQQCQSPQIAQQLNPSPHSVEAFTQSPNAYQYAKTPQSIDKIHQPHGYQQLNPSFKSLDKIHKSPQTYQHISHSPHSMENVHNSPQMMQRVTPSPQILERIYPSPQMSNQMCLSPQNFDKYQQPSQIYQHINTISQSIEETYTCQSHQQINKPSISNNFYQQLSQTLINSPLIQSYTDSINQTPQSIQQRLGYSDKTQFPSYRFQHSGSVLQTRPSIYQIPQTTQDNTPIQQLTSTNTTNINLNRNYSFPNKSFSQIDNSQLFGARNNSMEFNRAHSQVCEGGQLFCSSIFSTSQSSENLASNYYSQSKILSKDHSITEFGDNVFIDNNTKKETQLSSVNCSNVSYNSNPNVSFNLNPNQQSLNQQSINALHTTLADLQHVYSNNLNNVQPMISDIELSTNVFTSSSTIYTSVCIHSKCDPSDFSRVIYNQSNIELFTDTIPHSSDNYVAVTTSIPLNFSNPNETCFFPTLHASNAGVTYSSVSITLCTNVSDSFNSVAQSHDLCSVQTSTVCQFSPLFDQPQIIDNSACSTTVSTICNPIVTSDYYVQHHGLRGGGFNFDISDFCTRSRNWWKLGLKGGTNDRQDTSLMLKSICTMSTGASYTSPSRFQTFDTIRISRPLTAPTSTFMTRLIRPMHSFSPQNSVYSMNSDEKLPIYTSHRSAAFTLAEPCRVTSICAVTTSSSTSVRSSTSLLSPRVFSPMTIGGVVLSSENKNVLLKKLLQNVSSSHAFIVSTSSVISINAMNYQSVVTPASAVSMSTCIGQNFQSSTTPIEIKSSIFHEDQDEIKKMKRRQYQQKRRHNSRDGVTSVNKKRFKKNNIRLDDDYDLFVESIISQLSNLPRLSVQESIVLLNISELVPLGGKALIHLCDRPAYDLELGELESIDLSNNEFMLQLKTDSKDFYGRKPFSDINIEPVEHRLKKKLFGFYNQEFTRKCETVPVRESKQLLDMSCDSSCRFVSQLMEEENLSSPETIISCSSPDYDFESTNHYPGLQLADDDVFDRTVSRSSSNNFGSFFQFTSCSSPDLKSVSSITDSYINGYSQEQTTESDQVSVTLTLMTKKSKDVVSILRNLASVLRIQLPDHCQVYETRTDDLVKIDSNHFMWPSSEQKCVNIHEVICNEKRLCSYCGRAIVDNPAVTIHSKKIEDNEEIDCSNSMEYPLLFCTESCCSRYSGNLYEEWKISVKKDQPTCTSTKPVSEDKKDHIVSNIGQNNLLETTVDQSGKHKWKNIRYRLWSPSFQPVNKHRSLSENELTQLLFRMAICMIPSHLVQDRRRCILCHMYGDLTSDGASRLLNLDIDKWIHLNCALWASEVFETESGALVNVSKAVQRSLECVCRSCSLSGASVHCFKPRCDQYLHVMCALKHKCTFYQNKTVFCREHQPKCSSAVLSGPISVSSGNLVTSSRTLEARDTQELTSLSVHRRVFISRERMSQIASLMHQTYGTDQTHLLRVGSLVFLSPGQIPPPPRSSAFHTRFHLFPLGYRIIRYFWSFRRVNKRCCYICSIIERHGRPFFSVRAVQEPGDLEDVEFCGSSCLEAWSSILEKLIELRNKHSMLCFFPKHFSGQDLFGLNETCIVRILESLPGVDTLVDYCFRHKRHPLLESALIVNPSGCARCEPRVISQQRRSKRRHITLNNFSEFSSRMSRDHDTPVLSFHYQHHVLTSSSQTNHSASSVLPSFSMQSYNTGFGTHSKHLQHTRVSQYKRMKLEWRQNVYLARSRIQGLGLYAARTLERHTMVIEYVGEVIRAQLAELRESRYEAQHRGVYMFRLDDTHVLDATLCGGLARYINHSCEPCCVAETLELERGRHRIVILTRRRIQRGEELSYDYKLEYEDDARKIACMCGAANCRKWMN